MSGEGRPAPLRVLRQRNFWPYFCGNLLSNTGTWFQTIAQTILVYRLTGSTLLVGLVNFAQFAGVFLLAPWAGTAADRYDRRRLLITTQAVAVVLTGSLAALQGAGLAEAPVVIGMAFLLGLGTAFAIPAMQALVPDLVGDDELAPAMALNAVTFHLARAVGPVAGAFVVDRFGIAAAFAGNALSYLALIGGLMMVRPRSGHVPAAERPRWRESLALVRDDKALRTLLLTVGAIAISQDPVITLAPEFSERVFGRSDTLSGMLLGVFGAGSVLAAVTLVGRIKEPLQALPFSCAVMAAGMVGFALSGSLPFAYVSLAVGGYAFLLTNTSATVAVQQRAAAGHRGRVMALWSLCFLGTRPFASLLDGALASALGPRWAALVMTVPVLVTAGALFRARAATARTGRPSGRTAPGPDAASPPLTP